MNEAAWLLGILLCSLGVCLCTKAGFGLSMIAAPAYILHSKLFPLSSFFTQGACEYLWQGFLLVIMCFGVRRFRFRYLLAFGTGILFGFALDGWFVIFGGNAVYASMGMRIFAFALGELITTLAVAFYFRTKLPLQIYELMVTEIAARYHLAASRTKLVYDISMLVVSLLLALILNRSLDGIGVGTVIITAINAVLIGAFGKLLDRLFEFSPRFPKLTKFLSGS